MKRKLFISIIILLGLTGCNRTVIIDINKEQMNIANEKEVSNDSTDPFKNLFSFHFKIDNNVVYVGMTLQELLDAGWSCNNDSNAMIIGDTSVLDITFTKGNASFIGTILNPSDYYNLASYCLLSQVQLDADNSNIVLPKDIIVGQSKKDDVLEAYGEPNSDVPVEDKDQTLYIYEYDKDETITLTIDDKSDQLVSVTILRIKEKEPLTTVPTNITNYQGATSLQKKLDSTVFSLENTVYKMPVPVIQFINNGWTIEDINEVVSKDMILKSGELVRCHLVKADGSIEVAIKNYSLTKDTILNSYISEIEFTNTSPYTPIISPSLTFVSTKEDVLAVIKNYKYVSSNTETMDVYQIYFTETTSAIIHVDKTTNHVSYFQMANFPE